MSNPVSGDGATLPIGTPMTFSHAYLYVPGDARLVYNVAGGQRERAFPVYLPAATAAEWDAETLTMAYTLDDDSIVETVLTEQDIEDAKLTPAL